LNSRQSNIYIFVSIAILAAAAAWIYLSRAAPGETTSGKIPAPRAGFLAPDFTLPAASGELIKLSDLRGQPILVNFWASWCGPCRAEMPAMERVYQDYRSKGLQILAVNSTIQDTTQQASAFAGQNNLTFPILFDEQGDATRLYQVRALPTSYFIDENGVISEVVVGGPMSEALLRIRIDQIMKSNLGAEP
jgi:cytochrome c biogenesis protein CcmG, thiol:disulfide interchange protein DsbE